jgi:non-lysosomal glucosylceramidase
LRDWEIFNRPNKNSVLPFTFAALRLAGGELSKPKVRVLERQPLPPYHSAQGLPRETAVGLPRFKEAEFTGAYPFAHLRLIDPRFPVEVTLEAFNPMVPLETDDSSLPVAVLTYSARSRAQSKLDASLAFSIMNPVGYDGVTELHSRQAKFFGANLNEFRTGDHLKGLHLTSNKYAPDSTRYGSLSVLTQWDDVSYRATWEHGQWWDDFQKWWDEYAGTGRFPSAPAGPSEDGHSDYATLACHFKLAPGETKRITFVLAWHFPNVENYWSGAEARQHPLKNHYGTRWLSAWEPAVYTLKNLESLRQRSLGYRDALFSSTLPDSVIDAVSSQASILRTNTVMVLENKLTLAFEGCDDNGGCCPMNCTHVYNYEQAMAHLYPDLERSMRETDFLVNMRPDGSMSFRTPVPLQQGGNKIHPAADGQMGCVMKVYREWRLSGDDEWLRKLWPNVKRALEYAWVNWDADRDGMMEGEQHNTYDIEFYGPNSMMGTLYLGALRAAARMARHLGDSVADEYDRLAAKGSSALDALLWNGEYYVQKIDEAREKAKRYQYGEGCLSDQLLGQWFAEVVGLGKVLPHDHIRTTLRSIYKYNFRSDFSDFPNAQRIYALNDEGGLLLCSWPHDRRPELPFVYSDEVWTGIGYQVAAHLIYEGLVQEGLSVVKAARERYDGVRRNPWNEIECGNHYARAMSSWSILTALSGFSFSAPDKTIRFRPRVRAADFNSLFSTGTAWGKYAQKLENGKTQVELRVEGGTLELASFRAPFTGGRGKVAVPRRATMAVEAGEATVRFASPVTLRKGENLEISLVEA